jgi:hypothetical protein
MSPSDRKRSGNAELPAFVEVLLSRFADDGHLGGPPVIPVVIISTALTAPAVS